LEAVCQIHRDQQIERNALGKGLLLGYYHYHVVVAALMYQCEQGSDLHFLLKDAVANNWNQLLLVELLPPLLERSSFVGHHSWPDKLGDTHSEESFLEDLHVLKLQQQMPWDVTEGSLGESLQLQQQLQPLLQTPDPSPADHCYQKMTMQLVGWDKFQA
jgi:hypothetical protein